MEVGAVCRSMRGNADVDEAARTLSFEEVLRLIDTAEDETRRFLEESPDPSLATYSCTRFI